MTHSPLDHSHVNRTPHGPNSWSWLILKTIGLCLLALPLAGCASLSGDSLMDPRYRARLKQALRSPQSDAIVGMWFNHFDGGDNSSASMSMLIKSDGTGISRSSGHDSLGSPFPGSGVNFPLKWTYLGNGSWTVTVSHPSYPSITSAIQTDGEVLLVEAVRNGVRLQQVWVRADDEAAVAKKRR